MSDRISQLETLARLKAEGTLTEEEFARRKALLMEGDPNAEKLGRKERYHIGREFVRRLTGSMLRWGLVSAGVVFLIGAYFFGKAAVLAEARGELGAGASRLVSEAGSPASDVSWTVSSSVDPMTDMKSQVASARFPTDRYDIEASVSCRSDGFVAYTFTTFDKSSHPAEMRTEIDPNVADLKIPFQVRVDDLPAQDWSNISPRYSNQITIDSKWASVGFPNQHVGDGTRMLTRLFLVDGEATILIDQTVPALRQVLQPCLASAASRERQEAAARDAEQSARRVRNEAYINGLYDTDEVDASTLEWLASNRNVAVDPERLARKRARDAEKERCLQTRRDRGTHGEECYGAGASALTNTGT
jgi:hypothetical protein